MPTPFCTIPEAVAELKAGHFIILVDDEHRENEGDLVCAAELITPEMVNFALRAHGIICVPMLRDRCRKLNLQPQTSDNTATMRTAFTVTVDAHPRFGVTTGTSAFDRATTIRLLADPATGPDDLLQPGHINPLMARDGGVLV